MKKEMYHGRIGKRIVCFLLALAMIVTLMPTMRFDASAATSTNAAELLKFTAEQDNSTVALSYSDGSVQYSLDGNNWVDYVSNTEITLNNINDFVYFRGNNIQTEAYQYTYHGFAMTGKIAASGDVTSLVNGVGGDASLTDCRLQGLFRYCDALTSAPNLPSTTMTGGCYRNMFSNCTSLVSAPSLPATTLAESCYNLMFSECTSLKSVPQLNATTLASSCYESMFSGCSSITETPKLEATTLKTFCYYNMFGCCTSLTKTPELPATILVGNCYNGMFQKCTALATVPKLKATELAANCYKDMFNGCTSLIVTETSNTEEASWTFPSLTTEEEERCGYWNDGMLYGLSAEGTLTAVSAGKSYKVAFDYRKVTFDANGGTMNYASNSDYICKTSTGAAVSLTDSEITTLSSYLSDTVTKLNIDYYFSLEVRNAASNTLLTDSISLPTLSDYLNNDDSVYFTFEKSENCTNGAEIESTATREGYKFDGWTATKNGTDYVTNVTTDIQLYAHWTEKDTLDVSDFTYAAPASTKGDASVSTSKTGVGTLTIYYSSDNGSTWTTTVPSNEGTYKVAVKVTEGLEYKKTDYITNSSWTFSYGHINATKHVKVDATCTTTGMKEYWTCDDCGAKLDKDGNLVTDASLAISATGHTITKVDAVAATTTSTGNREYYKCLVCGKLFLDATGTTETTLADVTLAKLTETTESDNTSTSETTSKKTNPMKMKATSKTFKCSSLKKKKATVSISFSKKAQGKVTYTLSKSAKKAGIKVSSNGKITVPKECKKGTYKITVKATGNDKYKASSKIFTVKVK